MMNLKFKKSIQVKLNNLFMEEEYREYTLGDLTKIIVMNIITLSILLATMFLVA